MAVRLVLLLLFAISGADASRIVGGRDAAPHSRPYMASLQAGGNHLCGGALIKEDFVVTAASCAGVTTVVLGVDSLQGNEQTKQEFSVFKSIPHPAYNNPKNDIMLLRLSSKAQLTEAVQVIPLMSGNLMPESRCMTAGWGVIGDNMISPNRLQEVNVTTLSRRACQRQWRDIDIDIASSMVCGVGDRPYQGFCQGDAGSPLVCNGAIAGVASFSGSRCGNPMTPDVYTRISCFTHWITTVLKTS